MRDAPLNPHIKTIIDVEMLSQLVVQCDRMYMGTIFKAAFIIFSVFLRISNFVLHYIATFDYMKQLARADVIFAPPGAHLIIKWSKTLKIPSLGSSNLCPVAALKVMLKLYECDKNSPLFQIKCYGTWVLLTDT